MRLLRPGEWDLIAQLLLAGLCYFSFNADFNVYLFVCGFRNPPLKPRLSHPLPQTRMNDTYAVVNKPRLQPPSSATNSNTVHHYDNANSEKSNKTPVYSAVKPKNRPGSLLPPPTSPVYDRTTTANQRGGLPPKVMDHDGYELLPGKGLLEWLVFLLN